MAGKRRVTDNSSIDENACIIIKASELPEEYKYLTVQRPSMAAIMKSKEFQEDNEGHGQAAAASSGNDGKPLMKTSDVDISPSSPDRQRGSCAAGRHIVEDDADSESLASPDIDSDCSDDEFSCER